jgi:hypothetical protein
MVGSRVIDVLLIAVGFLAGWIIGLTYENRRLRDKMKAWQQRERLRMLGLVTDDRDAMDTLRQGNGDQLE